MGRITIQFFFYKRLTTPYSNSFPKFIKKNQKVLEKSGVIIWIFFSGKKQYEKVWCDTCTMWVSGGKTQLTSHVKNTHGEEDCNVVHITNQVAFQYNVMVIFGKCLAT